MSLANSIYATLSANAPLVALVGKRIYLGNGPDNPVAPYIIWQGIGADPGQVHTGATGATERLMQFACFAETPEGAIAVRDALVAALDGVTLANGDNGTLEDDNRDDFDEAAQLYRCDADFHF